MFKLLRRKPRIQGPRFVHADLPGGTRMSWNADTDQWFLGEKEVDAEWANFALGPSIVARMKRMAA